MSRPSRADAAAQHQIDDYRAANPKTFDEFCAEHRATDEERAELAYRLAELRYTKTLVACFPALACLRGKE
jgi:hypothetical protein